MPRPCLSPPAGISPSAHGEVKESGADHLLVGRALTIHASPDKVYAALVDIGRWQDGEHTYSGDAANLSLQPSASGCFCERWGAQSVAHGRVIWTNPGHLLRPESAPGPLHSLAVQRVITFVLQAGGR